MEIEAEHYHRGNGRVSFDLAPQRGVVVSRPGVVSTHAEFDLDVIQAGEYEFQLRYAAASARPVDVFVDDLFVGKAATDATGGWEAQSLAWGAGLTLNLRSGPHLLRIERAGAFPRIDRLRFRRN